MKSINKDNPTNRSDKGSAHNTGRPENNGAQQSRPGMRNGKGNHYFNTPATDIERHNKEWFGTNMDQLDAE